MTKRHAIMNTALAGYLRSAKATMVVDGQGLFLATNGERQGSWKFEFKSPASLKRTKTTLGKCWLAADGKTVMGMSLKEAREAHDKARELVVMGNDPNVLRATALAAREAAVLAERELREENRRRLRDDLPPKDSLRDACERWADAHRGHLDPATIRDFERCMKLHAFPVVVSKKGEKEALLGDKLIAQITSQDIASMDSAVSAKGILPTLGKVRRHLDNVFNWAMQPAQSLVTTSPMFENKLLFINMPEPKSHAALLEVDEIRTLMLALNAPLEALTPARAIQQRALKFTALTGQRNNNIVEARWEHIDTAAGTWTIPAMAVKGKVVIKRKASAKDHVVYLSRQAVELLQAQRAAFPDSQWVFPSAEGDDGSMARNGMSLRLNELGFQGKQTPHGFRATMRTAGEVHAGLNALVLETMLAHKGAKDGVEQSAAMQKTLEKMLTGGMPGVYDRKAELLRKGFEQQCRDAVQGWADWLDDIVRPKLALVA